MQKLVSAYQAMKITCTIYKNQSHQETQVTLHLAKTMEHGIDYHDIVFVFDSHTEKFIEYKPIDL